MKYITIDDIENLVRTNIIPEVAEDDYTMFDEIEHAALSIIANYIGSIYDLEAEYRNEGALRNGQLVQVATDIFIYDFFTRMSIEAMSVLRKERYEAALEWLQDVSEGMKRVALPMLDPDFTDGVNQRGMYGSNDKNNYIY